MFFITVRVQICNQTAMSYNKSQPSTIDTTDTRSGVFVNFTFAYNEQMNTNGIIYLDGNPE